MELKNWEHNLINSREQIRDLLGRTKRIAVLGMETVSYTHLTLPTNREV